MAHVEDDRPGQNIAGRIGGRAMDSFSPTRQGTAAGARRIVRGAAMALSTFIIAWGLAMPAPARAQSGEFCTAQKKETIAGHIFDHPFVKRCVDLKADEREVNGGDHVSFAAAMALLSTLSAASPPPVWCLGQRRNTEMDIEEATVTREDHVADFGMQNNLHN